MAMSLIADGLQMLILSHITERDYKFVTTNTEPYFRYTQPKIIAGHFNYKDPPQ